MSYTTLMVHVDADGEPEERVQLAAGLADEFGASLTGVCALAIMPPVAAEGIVVPDVTEVEIDGLKVRLADKEKWFRRIATFDHRQPEWRAALDFPIEMLAREARSADLVVIGRTAGPGGPYSSLDPGAAILETGRPMLIVPDGVGSLLPDHVVIGWKDTREARRAVRDALPFCQAAKTVTIVEICTSDEEGDAQERIDGVARYLTRHRIVASPRLVRQQKGSAAGQLIAVAQELGADLIVTGAYGHSRLGEWIFGGMTRDLLATCPICCLMSH